jgi:polar amino acid transport system permease protein
LRQSRNKITPLDIIVAVALLAAGAYVIYRITVGLHYKWNWPAIPKYLFRYDQQSKEWLPNVLIYGLLTTIKLSIWGTVLATIIGALMGLFRVSQSLFKRLIGSTYVELIRNLPPLVLIFIFYFFLGDQIMSLLGVSRFIESCSKSTCSVLSFFFAPPSLFTHFMSALITLALFEGAYITEIIRAGVQSIERGQWEASYALGFSRWQQMRYIIIPQAMPRILPPLAGQFISTIKDSAIVSVISIQELTFQGMELMSATYLTFEIWITITGLYLMLTLSLSLVVERFEIYLRRSEA